MSTEFVILGITLISSLGFLGVSFLLHHTKSKWFLFLFFIPLTLLIAVFTLILREIVVIQCNGIVPSSSIRLEADDLKKAYELASTPEPSRARELCKELSK